MLADHAAPACYQLLSWQRQEAYFGRGNEMGADGISPGQNQPFAFQQLRVMCHGHMWRRLVPQAADTSAGRDGRRQCLNGCTLMLQ